MGPDFLQPIILTLIEDCSQCGIGPNGPGFLGWAMYYWYNMAFFEETPEDKYEAETIFVHYINFQILTIFPLCVVFNPN
jgi:hypothetical protein